MNKSNSYSNFPKFSETGLSSKLILMPKPITFSSGVDNSTKIAKDDNFTFPSAHENDKNYLKSFINKTTEMKNSELITDICLSKTKTINNSNVDLFNQTLSTNENNRKVEDTLRINTSLITNQEIVLTQFDNQTDNSNIEEDHKIIYLKPVEDLFNRLFKNEKIQIIDLDLNYAELHILVEVLMRKNRKFTFKYVKKKPNNYFDSRNL